MSGKKGMTHYSAELKREAVRRFLAEGKTYRTIAEELGIRKAERIEVWVRDFRREGQAGLTKPKGRPRKGEQSELERLRGVFHMNLHEEKGYGDSTSRTTNVQNVQNQGLLCVTG
ncbi:MAG: helix-turn-helix domain-containing protein [Anaerolineales bacterium]